MAVVRTRSTDGRLLCLSGDVKPTTGIGVGMGITEIDTGKRYIWYMGTWIEDITWIYAIKQGIEV